MTEEQALAERWLTTPQARQAAIEGWHAHAHQKLANGDLEKIDQRMAARFKREAEEAARMMRDAGGVQDAGMIKRIMLSAATIMEKRLRLYERMRRGSHPDLPEHPDWWIDTKALREAAA